MRRHLGRMLCRMRLHDWETVTVITGFRLDSITMTPGQWAAAKAAYPPPPLKPWETLPPAVEALAGVPVYLGAAGLRGKVTSSRKEDQCRRPGCRAVRPTG